MTSKKAQPKHNDRDQTKAIYKAAAKAKAEVKTSGIARYEANKKHQDVEPKDKQQAEARARARAKHQYEKKEQCIDQTKRKHLVKKKECQR